MTLEEKVLMLKALGDETRLQIVSMLSQENLCACQLQEAFSISGATLSYHLRLLQESGLITGKKEGYWTRYFLDKEKLGELLACLDKLIPSKASNPPIRCNT